MAFGVGLGFKDGIGKASEFFAGYVNFLFKASCYCLFSLSIMLRMLSSDHNSVFHIKQKGGS